MSDDDYKLSPEAQAVVDDIRARGNKCAGCGNAESGMHWVTLDGNFCMDCVVARSYSVPSLRSEMARLRAALSTALRWAEEDVTHAVAYDTAIAEMRRALALPERPPGAFGEEYLRSQLAIERQRVATVERERDEARGDAATMAIWDERKTGELLRLGADLAERDRRIAELESKNNTPLVHYALIPFRAICGADVPSQTTTASLSGVTCEACIDIARTE